MVKLIQGFEADSNEDGMIYSMVIEYNEDGGDATIAELLKTSSEFSKELGFDDECRYPISRRLIDYFYGEYSNVFEIGGYDIYINNEKNGRIHTVCLKAVTSKNEGEEG